jgi:dolichyl-phosphate beta-glucosyltransferase
MTIKTPELSVIIPAYNEELRLPSTLRKILNYLSSAGYDFELIVVDDGSSDGTVALVNRIAAEDGRVRLLSNNGRRGKGFSVRNGILSASGRYRVFSDADLSTPIEEVEKLIGRLKSGCDVVFGSRALSDSDVVVREAWYRDAMGKVFGFLVRSIALPGVSDSQCGFKGFSGNVASRLFALQRLTGFAFDVEILFIARKMGLSTEEVPVRWIDSPKSKVNPVLDSFKMLCELIKIRINNATGAYGKR